MHSLKIINGLCVCVCGGGGGACVHAYVCVGARGWLFCDPVNVVESIALDGRMINEFEGI
jgi:hypothetical protein